MIMHFSSYLSCLTHSLECVHKREFWLTTFPPLGKEHQVFHTSAPSPLPAPCLASPRHINFSFGWWVLYVRFWTHLGHQAWSQLGVQTGSELGGSTRCHLDLQPGREIMSVCQIFRIYCNWSNSYQTISTGCIIDPDPIQTYMWTPVEFTLDLVTGLSWFWRSLTSSIVHVCWLLWGFVCLDEFRADAWWVESVTVLWRMRWERFGKAEIGWLYRSWEVVVISQTVPNGMRMILRRRSWVDSQW